VRNPGDMNYALLWHLDVEHVSAEHVTTQIVFQEIS
jgi:hypothetical protein